MILTAFGLSHYLLECGLVSSSSLVDGDLRVQDLSRRNRVFRVRRGPHPGYIVKQVKKWKARSIETLEREAYFYSLLRSDLALTGLRRFVPQCHAYDSENHVLVMELVREPPFDLAAQLSSEYARSIGASLWQWHQEARTGPGVLQDFNPYAALPFAFHRPPDDSADEPRRANAELRRLVMRDTDCCLALDALAEQWHPQTLIHGDMKWGNCLMADNAADSPLRFVDWEMAGWGDPLWDAAGILHEYLVAWARWGEPLEKVAPPMRAFWAAYGNDTGPLQRLIGYTAARMIQGAFEVQQDAEEMTAPAIRLLQASFNILKSPDQAIAVFFGHA